MEAYTYRAAPGSISNGLAPGTRLMYRRRRKHALPWGYMMRAIDRVEAVKDPVRKRDEAETAKLRAWIKPWRAD